MRSSNQTKVILGLERDDLQEDCQLASLLITPFYAPRLCDKAFVIDHEVVTHYGAVALYREDRPLAAGHESERYRLVGARDPRKNRPWAAHPPRDEGAAPSQPMTQGGPPDPEAEPLTPR